MNERNDPVQADLLQLPECPDCDSTDSRLEYRLQSFRHGRGDDSVDVSCEVPVYTCNHCGLEWCPPEAEDVRQTAVCRSLGRLNPDEVRGVREKFRLSQAEFSRITGFGEASLSRWETGAQVQNTSSDRLLRLIIADPGNLQLLEQMAKAKTAPTASRFKVITITQEMRERQASFRLLRAS
jgi:putative zinc finger/helix-turn-helix YgiT family protein